MEALCCLIKMKLFIAKLKERWNKFKSNIVNFFKSESYIELKDNLGFLISYSIIVFLGTLFLLNVLRGILISTWLGTILNILGAGCIYYIILDFLRFLHDTFKKEEKE